MYICIRYNSTYVDIVLRGDDEATTVCGLF